MEFTYLMQAIQTVAEPMNFAIAVISTLAGLVMGMLPGLSATMAEKAPM